MFGTILLAVDRSPQADRAADLAAHFAAPSGDEVVVLHVIQEHLTQGGPLASETDASASELVDGFVTRLDGLGAKARPEVTHALDGYVGRVIADVADQQGAGLIVMGSRSRSDLGALLLGSVAHKVLHMATCPVLVAR
jgi:nucleotide-binding universal stress UspA family protein